MEENLMQKLQILADSAKYDVSCSSSGSSRQANGRMGNGHMAGICHSWAADGRCVSLLKVLFTNKCVYNCEYCVNRRTNDFPRASFEPDELARLTMEFYRRNYIEGLFLSSAVEVSPDYTAEKILECLELLRYRYGFAGYIHAKIIPGVSPEILHRIGLVADRLSVNIEMPSRESLAAFAPQKKIEQIVAPMRQITNTLIETKSLKGPGTMFKGQRLNDAADLTENDLTEKIWIDAAMPFSYITEDLVRSLSLLEPCGQGNERPLFAQKNVKIRSVRVVGRNRNVVRLSLTGEDGFTIDGVAFTDGDRFLEELKERRVFDILYYPAINEYMGRNTLQIVIRGWKFRT